MPPQSGFSKAFAPESFSRYTILPNMRVALIIRYLTPHSEGILFFILGKTGISVIGVVVALWAQAACGFLFML